jgi:hypothetical protein
LALIPETPALTTRVVEKIFHRPAKLVVETV